MGRAKRVLSKREKSIQTLPRAAQQQSTRDASMTPTASVIDVSTPTIIQPGTIIHNVGIVTDTDVRYDGHSVQVTYKVSGISTNGYVVSASEGMPATHSVSPIEYEAYMKLRIKDVLRSDQYRESTLIQRVLSDDTCDVSTLVNALSMCESTLQQVYALTQIAGAIDDVDYHRFLQSLRTLIIDESGVELDAQQWSTPLENSDGRGSMLGDGLSEIQEKNGLVDHMDGVAKEKKRVTCKHCNAGQLFDNGMCKVCTRDLPHPTNEDYLGLTQDTTVWNGQHLKCGVCAAINLRTNTICGKCGNTLQNVYRNPAQFVQEMYGTFSDPQQRCRQCGATIEDKTYTCRRCGVSVYSGPIVTMETVPVGKQIHPVLCTGCNKYYMDDKDVCPGCQTPRGAVSQQGVVCWHCNEINRAFDMRGCKACGAPLYDVVNGQYVVKTSNGEIQKMGDTVLLQWDEVLDKTGVPKLGDKDVVVDME